MWFLDSYFLGLSIWKDGLCLSGCMDHYRDYIRKYSFGVYHGSIQIQGGDLKLFPSDGHQDASIR